MNDFNPNRRKFVMSGAALATGALILPSSVWAQGSVSPDIRELSLFNAHTSESASECYFDGSGYVPSALKVFNHLCRDHRQNKSIDLDPRLYDQLVAIKHILKTDKRCVVLSGYRSEETNNMLRKRGGGQALKSFHITGQAIDFTIEGIPLKRIRQAAMSLKAGGVGFYPKSNFIHIDTGPVRYWG
ncbi:hypothetical protein CS022_03840 [Veronia nyctiphanis]|uniref:Murein endopeptidase K n=1 Tax=Veronia nyctiphanis TaxID=1278244 RepID=A0A4Q0YSM2_9GAMM|nr:YcbK family protein [Veronia nyctiphanis]RXJ74212.1 hypothetical protein CS022_03840 [Veronia nyctiphanis]